MTKLECYRFQKSIVFPTSRRAIVERVEMCHLLSNWCGGCVDYCRAWFGGTTSASVEMTAFGRVHKGGLETTSLSLV